MSAISSSIFAGSDCTLAVSTSSRLLGCIILPVFVAWGFPCDGDRGICGVWSALCCLIKYCAQKIKQKIYYYFLLLKKDWQCNAGRKRLPPYQSEDPSPTLPTYRGKEEKGIIVEDKKVESN